MTSFKKKYYRQLKNNKLVKFEKNSYINYHLSIFFPNFEPFLIWSIHTDSFTFGLQFTFSSKSLVHDLGLSFIFFFSIIFNYYRLLLIVDDQAQMNNICHLVLRFKFFLTQHTLKSNQNHKYITLFCTPF